MQYETFKYLIIEKLHSHFHEPKKITVHEITKNNGIKLEGLVILDEGMNIAPTLYLDYYFKKYQEGATFQEVLDEMIFHYTQNCPCCPVDVSFFTDFEQVKDRIVYKVIHYERNKELLHELPHFPFLDLAIVFYCLIHSDQTGNASILIHRHHMQRWNVTEQELMNLASVNTPKLLEYDFRSMKNILSSDFNTNVTGMYPMFVLTNYARLNGASCILYEGLLKQISELMSSDFYILPSSIHEVILIPANDKNVISLLSNMVSDVNAEAVCEDEILSNRAYYYSRQDDCITL